MHVNMKRKHPGIIERDSNKCSDRRHSKDCRDTDGGQEGRQRPEVYRCCSGDMFG